MKVLGLVRKTLNYTTRTRKLVPRRCKILFFIHLHNWITPFLHPLSVWCDPVIVQRNYVTDPTSPIRLLYMTPHVYTPTKADIGYITRYRLHFEQWCIYEYNGYIVFYLKSIILSHFVKNWFIFVENWFIFCRKLARKKKLKQICLYM